jgi:hypothetical protein
LFEIHKEEKFTVNINDVGKWSGNQLKALENMQKNESR